MATADRIKSLIKAHYDQDIERFKIYAFKISAYEARLGCFTEYKTKMVVGDYE